ncbi:MAG: hypothetical protein ACSHYC_21020 [Alphaproteobacteria bacterium]
MSFGGYVHTDQDDDDTDTSGRAFAGLEAQRYFEREEGEPEEVFEHSIWAGLKYRFGVDGTLKQQDRARPNLDLPPLLLWLAQTGGPLG